MVLGFLITTLVVFGLNLMLNLFLLSNSIQQDTPKTSIVIALVVTLFLITWNLYCIFSW